MQNPKPTSNPIKTPSPLSKFPRWAWWLIIGLALAAILGGGAAALIQTRRANIRSDFPTRPNPFSGWKIYQNEESGFVFKYPSKITLNENAGQVILNHNIPYENHGDCDMKGDETTYPTLNDFNVTFAIVDKSLSETVREMSSYIPEENFDADGNLKASPGFIDEYQNGNLKGFSIYEGVEGCGWVIYYFPDGIGKTLVIKKDMVQMLSSVIAKEAMDKVLAVPGVISQDESEKIFRQTLSSFKLFHPQNQDDSNIDSGVIDTYNSGSASQNFLGQLEQPVSLKLGQSVFIESEDLTLTLTKINDSRCPVNRDVQCFWAGTVTIWLGVKKGKQDLEEVEVDLEKEVSVGGYSVSLRRVLPEADAGGTKLSEYIVSIFVKK